jgi:fluoroquinolone transport system ATP-binding protein
MLTVKNLSFSYQGASADTLKNLSFAMQQGEIFGFLGPSGSGKSTTQKILYKLLKGYRGEVNFQNKPLQQWGQEFYEQIGVSFELPNHYTKLTAAENLKFFGAFYGKPVKGVHAMLDMVGLADDADKLVSDFSKGMKMRLNFVRALLHNPPMLFLDEPTSGLDPINAGKIKNIISRLKAEGKTIFITTHNMFDADQLCDRVALLHNGEIKALDTPAHLKLQHGQRKVKLSLQGDDTELNFALDGLGQNPEFLQAITNNNVATIHSQEATLEEVFIKVTGQQLLV